MLFCLTPSYSVGDREIRPKVEVLGAEENSDEPDDSDDKGDSDDQEEEFDWYIQQEAPQEGEEEAGLRINTIRDHGYGFGFAQVGNDSFCAIYKCVEHSLLLYK